MDRRGEGEEERKSKEKKNLKAKGIVCNSRSTFVSTPPDAAETLLIRGLRAE